MEKIINQWIQCFIDENVVNSNELYEIFKIYIEEDRKQGSCLSLKKMIVISKAKETILPLKEVVVFINLFYDFEDFIKHIDSDKEFKEILSIFSKYIDYFEKKYIFLSISRILSSLDKNKALFLIKVILSSYSDVENFEEFFIKYIKEENIKNNILIDMIHSISDIDKNKKILDFFIKLNDKKILEIILSKTNENYIKILDSYLKVVEFKVVENASIFGTLLYYDNRVNKYVKKTQDKLKKKRELYTYKNGNTELRKDESEVQDLISYNLYFLLSGNNNPIIKGLRIIGKNFFISRKKIENEITKKPEKIKKLLEIIECNESKLKMKIQCCNHYIWSSAYLDYNNINLYSFFSKIIFDFLEEKKEYISNVICFIKNSNSVSAKSLLVNFLHKEQNPKLREKILFLKDYECFDKERLLFTPSCLFFLMHNMFEYEIIKSQFCIGDISIIEYFDKNRLIDVKLDEIENENITKDVKLILKSFKKFDKEQKTYPKNKLKVLFFNDKNSFFSILNENIENLNILNLINMFKILNVNGIEMFTNNEIKIISDKLINLRKKEDVFNLLICFLEFNNKYYAEKLIRILKDKNELKIKIKYDLIRDEDFFFVFNSIKKIHTLSFDSKFILEVEKRLFEKSIIRRDAEEFLIFMIQKEESKTIGILKKLNEKGFLTNKQFYNICGIDIHKFILQNNKNCIVINGNNNNVVGNIIN